MAKKLLNKIVKISLFAVSFFAYWFSIDEKYFHYVEDQERLKAEQEEE